MSSTTNALVRAMKRRSSSAPEAIADDFSQAVARRLEGRGIARVPGLPRDDSEPEWFDVAIEQHRRQQELASQREARRLAEEAAQEARRTPLPTILAGEISRAATAGGSASIPLNGAAVLRAALAGGGGTVNGEQS